MDINSQMAANTSKSLSKDSENTFDRLFEGNNKAQRAPLFKVESTYEKGHLTSTADSALYLSDEFTCSLGLEELVGDLRMVKPAESVMLSALSFSSGRFSPPGECVYTACGAVSFWCLIIADEMWGFRCWVKFSKG